MTSPTAYLQTLENEVNEHATAQQRAVEAMRAMQTEILKVREINDALKKQLQAGAGQATQLIQYKQYIAEARHTISTMESSIAALQVSGARGTDKLCISCSLLRGQVQASEKKLLAVRDHFLHMSEKCQVFEKATRDLLDSTANIRERATTAVETVIRAGYDGTPSRGSKYVVSEKFPNSPSGLRNSPIANNGIGMMQSSDQSVLSNGKGASVIQGLNNLTATDEKHTTSVSNAPLIRNTTDTSTRYAHTTDPTNSQGQSLASLLAGATATSGATSTTNARLQDTVGLNNYTVSGISKIEPVRNEMDNANTRHVETVYGPDLITAKTHAQGTFTSSQLGPVPAVAAASRGRGLIMTDRSSAAFATINPDATYPPSTISTTAIATTSTLNPQAPGLSITVPRHGDNFPLALPQDKNTHFASLLPAFLPPQQKQNVSSGVPARIKLPSPASFLNTMLKNAADYQQHSERSEDEGASARGVPVGYPAQGFATFVPNSSAVRRPWV